MSYALQTPEGEDLTSFDVQYREDGSIYHKFEFYLVALYKHMAAIPPSKGGTFLCDITKLRADLFDFVYENTCSKTVSTKISDTKREDVIKATIDTKKLILDWFLPKQEAFAKKWDLKIKQTGE